jgi:hypothetical protein
LGINSIWLQHEYTNETNREYQFFHSIVAPVDRSFDLRAGRQGTSISRALTRIVTTKNPGTFFADTCLIKELPKEIHQCISDRFTFFSRWLLQLALLLDHPLVKLRITSKQNHGKPNYMKAVLTMEGLLAMRRMRRLFTFFISHPLTRILPICHKDCPVIKCRPLIVFPPLARAAKVTGTVSVHVLVDENGHVFYARILSGHPLLWAVARRTACETQFKEYRSGKHQGVMHFIVENYDYLDVPMHANEVR